MDISFSGDAVRAMVLSAFLCFLLPIIFLGYYKMKKRDVKIFSFFIGVGFSILFTFIGRLVADWVVAVWLGLIDYLRADMHPVYAAIYSAVMSGILAQVSSYVALKYCMRGREGRSNAFLLGLGKGGFECIIYGGVLNIANLIMALLINAFGVEGYLSKLGIAKEEYAEQTKFIARQASASGSAILTDSALQFMAMGLHASLVILVYIALTNPKYRQFFPLAILLQIIGYLPAYLIQVNVLTNVTAGMVITGFYMLAVAVFTYRLYHSGAADE